MDQYTKRITTHLLSLTLLLSFNATAAVISVDDIGGFGPDTLTRDTDQGLDFLDVEFSLGRSFNDVSAEFGVGGDFEGFRYASLEEVINLANNFGVTPAFTPGDAAYIDTDISGLVDMLGETNSGMFSRQLIGMTGTFAPFPGTVRQVEFIDEFDDVTFDDRISSEVVFSGLVSESSPIKASYLVRAQPVPEPASIALMLAGASGLLAFRQRRNRRLW
jgi:hypothetical protein